MTYYQTKCAEKDPRQPDVGEEARLIHNALASIHLACDADAARTAGVQLVRNSDMCLSIASNLPESAIVLNHGFVEARTELISEAATIYRRAGVNRFFLSTDHTLDQGVLDSAQLRPARSWRRFRRVATQPVPVLLKEVPICEVQLGCASDFAQIVADAFDLGDISRPWLASLPEVPGWHVFQTELEGEVAGVGALYIANGYAWTDFGATSPEYRSRGVQKALLAHRIRFAQSLGCHTILTCTGEAVAGEAQISYRNIFALGFEEADLMLNFAPEQKI